MQSGDTCGACGHVDLRPWRSVPSFDERADRKVYLLRRCANCGTAVTYGRSEEDSARLHQGGVYSNPSPLVDRLLEPLRLLSDRAIVSALGDLRPGTTVLDLGAGDGRTLTLLRRRGCVVTGVEPFATMRSTALSVSRNRIEDVAVAPGSVDLVLLWHVLEHLDNPSRALDVAMRAVKPNGRIVIAVPRFDSLQARLGGNRWFHLDVPRHAYHFTHTGLVHLLERRGLRVVRTSESILDQGLVGMTQTLLNRLTVERNVAFRAFKTGSGSVQRRDLVVTALAAVPVALSGSLAEGIAAAYGRAGATVVHAVLGEA